MSGGGGAVGRAIGQADSARPAQGGVGYTPTPAANPYQSAFNSQQQAPQQGSMSPFVQQQLMRQQPQQMSGLQAAMMQLMGRYNQPTMRQQMPQYTQQRMSPLAYRPDLSNARAALNNVVPSVALQQQRAAEEAARLQAEQDAYNALHPQSNVYDGGGGGG